ncbi:hypothetical protein FWH13_01415 [Candidatus Saccharibacteria bacterium]|nr:hypothetical protein [Candidatus Saccharibacteria bacterium]
MGTSFGSMSDLELLKENIRGFIAGLSDEEFDGLYESITEAYRSKLGRSDSIPTRESLRGFLDALQRVAGDWLSALPGSISTEEDHQLVFALFAAAHDRYMEGTPRLDPEGL